MSATDNLGAQFGKKKNSSKVYNNIPEQRGTARVKSTYQAGGGTGREREDEERKGTSRSSGDHPYNPGCMHCTGR